MLQVQVTARRGERFFPPPLAGALKTTQFGGVDSPLSTLCELPPGRLLLNLMIYFSYIYIFTVHVFALYNSYIYHIQYIHNHIHTRGYCSRIATMYQAICNGEDGSSMCTTASHGSRDLSKMEPNHSETPAARSHIHSQPRSWTTVPNQ